MIIETNNLTKMYGNKTGCEGICLSVYEGQVFGFLGQNGAGKSTLVKMLVGLINPTSGSAQVLGKPLGNLESRRKIGFLPENFKYQDWLSGRQMLEFHGSLYGLNRREIRGRIKSLLETVGLTGREDQRIKTYSRGMQQRIGLAAALLPDPDLLFLDEPTSALDPIGRKEVRELILALKRRGNTVFLNSHLLSEVELVCDTVAIIKGGRIVSISQMTDLQSCAMIDAVLEEVTPQILSALSARSYQFTISGNTVRITLDQDRQIPEIASLIISQGGRLYELKKLSKSLEEEFLNINRDGGGKQC